MGQTKHTVAKNINRYRKAGIYFFIFLSLMVIGGAYVQRQAIYDQLYAWKLIPRPERLTELYFANHQQLPSVYSPGEQQQVTFTVRNLEHRPTSYSYAVMQEGADARPAKLLASGTFKLQHDEQKTVTGHIPFDDFGPRSKVSVTITYQGIAFGEDNPTVQQQSIYFWTTRS